MKTKKEILRWWIDIGKKTSDRNDYLDFYYEIDKKDIVLSDIRIDKNNRVVVVFNKRWKNPINLYFMDNECFRIVY